MVRSDLSGVDLPEEIMEIHVLLKGNTRESATTKRSANFKKKRYQFYTELTLIAQEI